MKVNLVNSKNLVKLQDECHNKSVKETKDSITIYLKRSTDLTPSADLCKLQQGSRIIFKLCPNLHGLQIHLYANYNEGGKFNRTLYNELLFSDKKFNEETYAQIYLNEPGPYHYYFTIDGEKSDLLVGEGRFVVDPKLMLRGEECKLESISMITYMTKSLGNLSQWEPRLQVASQTGFNFIHFTPVQSLGKSRSGYSILNQLELNPDFGTASWQDLKLLVDKMESEWGVLSICDIVLNHTANETPWLHTHPESTYNLINSPHLIPPYILDRLLLSLSDEISGNIYENRGVPSQIRSENHLNALRNVLSEKIGELRLEEFYLIDVNSCRGEGEYFKNGENVVHTYKRFGAKVGGDVPRWRVEEMNENMRSLVRNHLSAAIENIISGVRYERVNESGPRYPSVSSTNPLTQRYFEEICGIDESLTPEQMCCDPSKAPFIMAHNGWVMNDDPLRNFASAESNVYLRRELIAWGDSIKLKYGSCESESPFLWSHMKSYAELLCSTFHGLRLDNCHSTPLHVAQSVIDSGRVIRPQLLLVAELFTNSDVKDNVFVESLGINVLIREAQQAWSSHEEGRLLFRYGGKPVGAFKNSKFPPIANALLFDQTHDNPSGVEKRSVNDLLPTAALVSFGACAIGSNRGYDEIVPHHIHVVNETRHYAQFSPSASQEKGVIDFSTGMLAARKTLNKTHFMLSQEGFSEIYIDQLDPDIVSVTRSNPSSHNSIILVSYTSFSPPQPHFKRAPYSVKPLVIEGQVYEIIFEGRIVCSDKNKEDFSKDDEFINGLDVELEWRENLSPESSKYVKITKIEGGKTKIEFSEFQPGDVVSFSVKPFESTTEAISEILKNINSFELKEGISILDPISLNYVLYRCKEEEGGIYNVPNYGEFVYAGFQGVMSVLEEIAKNNDLGHPLCANLRDGNWLMNYISSRLLQNENSSQLGLVLEKLLRNVSKLPRYLIPTYFERVLSHVYKETVEHGLELLGKNNEGVSEFYKLLALTSYQFVGRGSGGALPAGGDFSDIIRDGKELISYSLCAGLPHFSTGYMRNWGRDTFISLPGLLLSTQRFEEAKEHILSYASVLSHGLIPNLLNEGSCRYNCRDATWWWLYSIILYCSKSPDSGLDLLNSFVRDNKKGEGVKKKLEDVMGEALQAHWEGIEFREEGAGTRIDAHMKDEGFNIKIYTDHTTGFIYGGNGSNCGTWMDKMGSSESGGNKGKPATPRDGAAVEIIGLSAAVLKYLSNSPIFNHQTVTDKNGDKTSLSDWFSLIQSNFESHFFIPSSSTAPLVNIRNIYKDTVGSSSPYADFQLRPNFLILLVVCPELIRAENAILALEEARKRLVSVIGVRTLDESDWNYDGNYYNVDSSEYKVANGFNYHQGPEWVWPMGYYLRARLLYSKESGVGEVTGILGRLYEALVKSPWRSLPELTNKNGDICRASCTAQAWSTATVLEALEDLRKLVP